MQPLDGADMRQVPITIISFATDTHCQSVSENLSGLGYPVRVVDRQQAFGPYQDKLEGVLVFLFGKRQSSSDDVIKLLSGTSHKPRLGIFEKENTAWDRRLIDYCNEFSLWPCAEQEIVARLDRLSARLLPDLDELAPSALSKALSELNIIGKSPAFMQSMQRILKFTRCEAPVLIDGETGTGKELAARAIHYLGGRRAYPFIPLNCGALPDNLVENELFGHEQGAFTDAKKSCPGLIAQAQGGTLFLDEVEALSAKAQVALLRFLQEKEYRPLGGKRILKADVRVVAATNTCLNKLVQQGRFREDLLYRLKILPLQIPPLRRRTGDIELLAEHFMRTYRRQYQQPNKFLSPAMISWLTQCAWPGNVRELENLLHREFLLAEGNVICCSDTPSSESQYEALESESNVHELDAQASFGDAKARVIEAFEKNYLSHLMAESHGNVSLAAKRADKERRAFGKLLKKHGIDKEVYR